MNCGDQPLPFFPDVYNEDWFFFSRRAAAREVGHVGDVSQEPYDPYGTPERARQEEFGDLLAEGLYALFEEQPEEMDYLLRVEAAHAKYWASFMLARRRNLHLTRLRLQQALEGGAGWREGEMIAALRSLTAAERQLESLSPDLCVDFLDAWATDLVAWERDTLRLAAVRGRARGV